MHLPILGNLPIIGDFRLLLLLLLLPPPPLLLLLLLLLLLQYSSPLTGLEWPRGFQEVKVPRFHDNGTEWW